MVQSSIYKTVNPNAKLNTKLINHGKIDRARAKGCDYRVNKWYKDSIYKTVNPNAKLNTKLTNHDKIDRARARGCDYRVSKWYKVVYTRQ